MTDWLTDLERDGYALLPAVVPGRELDPLVAAVDRLGRSVDLATRGGVRNIFELLPEARALATDPALFGLAGAALGPGCFAVRGILFDKTPAANWKVVWHQDLTIAVRERRDAAGFHPWSEKAGIPHVQPPVAVLERMVTLRLHLDDCGLENGPVRVLPGSHRAGRLSADAVERWRAEHPAVPTCLGRGGVLVMRPLLLHASSPATVPVHRRVLHVEYAAGELPGGLEWYERWGADDGRARVA